MQYHEEQDYTQSFDIGLWKRLLGYARPFYKHVAGVCALMLLLAERNPLRILATATIPVAAVYALAVHLLHTPVP